MAVAPTHDPVPGPGAAHVWRVPQRDDAPAPPQARDILSPAELERAARYHQDVHRNRYLRAHVALREILGAALGQPPAAVSFTTGPKGKPGLAGGGAAPLHFNLSDTRGLALVALSTDGPVGVDVERHRDDRSLLDVADRFFSPQEVRALRAVTPTARLAAFHRIWTRKEAYVKAVGHGLSLGLDTFDVSLEAGPGARLLATRPDAGEASRWRLLDLELGPQHSGALVVTATEQPTDVRWLDWCPAEAVR